LRCKQALFLNGQAADAAMCVLQPRLAGAGKALAHNVAGR